MYKLPLISYEMQVYLSASKTVRLQKELENTSFR